MNLGFFRYIGNSYIKNHDIDKFVQELNEALKVNKPKNQILSEKKSIYEDIQDKRKLSTVSKNQIKDKTDKIMHDIANKNGDVYFVAGKTDNGYVINKYQRNEEEKIGLISKEVPKKVGTNSVLRAVNGNLILDSNLTIQAKNQINEMVDEVIRKQDKFLEEYRKEEHIYLVTEDRDDKIYLWDLTDKPAYEIEEVDFPRELLSLAKEGTLLKFKNGDYELFSKYGFETLFKKEI